MSSVRTEIFYLLPILPVIYDSCFRYPITSTNSYWQCVSYETKCVRTFGLAIAFAYYNNQVVSTNRDRILYQLHIIDIVVRFRAVKYRGQAATLPRAHRNYFASGDACLWAAVNSSCLISWNTNYSFFFNLIERFHLFCK